MNFFDHRDLGNHLLQLCPEVVKHHVYSFASIFHAMHSAFSCGFVATELMIHTLEQNLAALATVHVYLLQHTTATYCNT
jgi:hypothetical protein